MEESLINYTQCTTTTSSCTSDDSFDVPLQDDTGVLHLMGHEVFSNDDLLKHIEENTPYEMLSHVVPEIQESRDKDFKELARKEKASERRHYFVFADFENSGAFEKLQSMKLRILGVPVLFQCVLRNIALSVIARKRHCAIFSLALSDHVICFTNFVDRVELNALRKKVRMMNGLVTADYEMAVNNDITLVARSAGRPKFESHQTMGKYALQRKWVDDCFALRKDINLKPSLLHLENPDTYSCPIFYQLKIALHGFSEEVDGDNGLIQHAQQLGARIVEYTDKSCTHLVMNSSLPPDSLKTILPNPGQNLEVVNDVWLWECMALDQYVPPRQYRFPADGGKKEARESSGNKKRKVDLGNFTPNKLRKSSELEGSVICNTSLTCELAAPALTKREMIIMEFVRTEESYVKHLTIIERNYFHQIYRVISDEAQPAQHHVSILDNYIMFSKIVPIKLAHQALLRELNRMLEHNAKCPKTRAIENKSTPQKRSRKTHGDVTCCRGDVTCCHDDVTCCHGDVTCCRRSFGKILLNWTGRDFDGAKDSCLEASQLQEIFQYDKNEYRDYNKSKQEREARDQEEGSKRKKSGEAERGEPVDVGKAYTCYLNSKEEIGRLIAQYETSSVRFKALLKAEGAKKENQRLSLRDLMIEPVQRLPRLILLVDAILNKTEASHPDRELLAKVQSRFKNIARKMNNDKQVCDSSYDLMKLMQDISGLPMDKMSANLEQKERHNAVSLTDIGSLAENSNVCLFLFELGRTKGTDKENKDLNENEKKIGEEENTAKKPNDGFTEYHDSALEIVRPRIKMGSVNSASSVERSKKSSYKHVVHVPLRAVTHVLQDLDSDDGFGITYVDPPPSSTANESKKCKKTEDKKSKEITLLFKLVLEDPATPLQLLNKRLSWHKSLVDSVNFSRQHYSLTDIEADSSMAFSSLEDKLVKENSTGSKDKSKRDIFNFAKRSVSRAFSQKQGKFAMRKTQSQFGLSTDGLEWKAGSPGPGRSVKYSKRTMRDSH